MCPANKPKPNTCRTRPFSNSLFPTVDEPPPQKLRSPAATDARFRGANRTGLWTSNAALQSLRAIHSGENESSEKASRSSLAILNNVPPNHRYDRHSLTPGPALVAARESSDANRVSISPIAVRGVVRHRGEFRSRSITNSTPRKLDRAMPLIEESCATCL